MHIGFCIVWLLGICPRIAQADEPLESVSVRCQGKLRTGVVAVGGETTGTTITFQKRTWELNLQDPILRSFAESHNKGPVSVKGTLRYVMGTERKVRWIVDVKSLEEREESDSPEGAQLTIRGTLKPPTTQTDPPTWTIESVGHTWPVDLSANKLQKRAEELAGLSVVVEGAIPAVDPAGTPTNTIQVESLDPALKITR